MLSSEVSAMNRRIAALRARGTRDQLLSVPSEGDLLAYFNGRALLDPGQVYAGDARVTTALDSMEPGAAAAMVKQVSDQLADPQAKRDAAAVLEKYTGVNSGWSTNATGTASLDHLSDRGEAMLRNRAANAAARRFWNQR